jgi:hypothetical protein
MRIQHVRVRRENLELSRPYQIAYKTVTSVENCFVELEADNGLTGIGAGNPSKQVTGESLDDAWQTMQPPRLDWLVGRDVRELGKLTGQVQTTFGKAPAYGRRWTLPCTICLPGTWAYPWRPSWGSASRNFPRPSPLASKAWPKRWPRPTSTWAGASAC